MNYLYGSLAILLALLGVEQYGEHRVQTKWDIETAKLQALAEQAKRQGKEITVALETQHLKDIQNAKSEAGKRAIADYLKSHGLLHPEGNCSQTQGSCVPNESTCQCGTWTGIEEFAGRCAQDSMTILEWQEWALRENLEVE